MGDLTPKSIVEELDKHIVGQEEAKRAVAVALCNRERRRKLPPEMRQEVKFSTKARLPFYTCH